MCTILVITITVILLLLYYLYVPANPVMVSSFVVAPTPLVCSDLNNMALAQKYYNNSSAYAGMYTMDPISSVQSGANTCDIKYQMTPVPGSTRTKTDIDWRRFSYADGDSGWSVNDMGEWKSGVLNT